MVQQFTSDGNIRSRVRKASPIGLRHKTTCRFVLARSMKKAYTSLGDPVLMPAACSKRNRGAYVIPEVGCRGWKTQVSR